jgi:hypothetical protein
MSTNSLTDLNNYSKENVSFTDDRAYNVIISGPLTDTNAINANEGDSLTPKWNQIAQEIISADSSTSANVSLEFGFSAAVAPQITYPTLPAGVTTSVPSSKVFKATGITTVSDLNNLINNTVIEIVDQEANFAYTTKVTYDVGAGAVNYTTTNNITIVTTFNELTVPATCWSGDVQASTSKTIDNPAVIIDTETGAAATYTITASIPTARVTGLTTSGSGGSASTATVGANMIRTITGTLAQVNSHLSTLALTLTATTGSLTIAYSLTNNLSGVVTTGSSAGGVITVIPWTNFAVARAYTENTVNTNIFASSPIQLDGTALNTAYSESTFKVRIQVQNGQSDSGVYGNPGSGNNILGWIRDASVASKEGHQQIDKTDTVTNLNTWLSTHIEYIPPPSVSSTQTIQVKLFRTNGNEIQSGAKDITVNGTANGSAVSGAGTTTYVTGSSPYANISITDNMRFFLKADILMVASGGIGGLGDDGVGTGDKGAGGGGGAGQLHYVSNSSLFTGGRNGYNDFDITIPGKLTGFHDSSNTVTLLGDGTTNIISAQSGGYGGYSQSTSGENGGTGGHGGGGGWDDDGSTNGNGGAAVVGATTVTYFTGGELVNSTSAGENANTERGGNGGGYTSGYTSSISGSSLTYAHKGLGGVLGGNNTVSGAFGSGGSGGYGAGDSANEYVRSNGQEGVVIIKLYEF